MAKVTVNFEPISVWLAFRAACIQRQTSASKELLRLMQDQLVRWSQEITTPTPERTSDGI